MEWNKLKCLKPKSKSGWIQFSAVIIILIQIIVGITFKLGHWTWLFTFAVWTLFLIAFKMDMKKLRKKTKDNSLDMFLPKPNLNMSFWRKMFPYTHEYGYSGAFFPLTFPDGSPRNDDGHTAYECVHCGYSLLIPRGEDKPKRASHPWFSGWHRDLLTGETASFVFCNNQTIKRKSIYWPWERLIFTIKIKYLDTFVNPIKRYTGINIEAESRFREQVAKAKLKGDNNFDL